MCSLLLLHCWFWRCPEMLLVLKVYALHSILLHPPPQDWTKIADEDAQGIVEVTYRTGTEPGRPPDVQVGAKNWRGEEGRAWQAGGADAATQQQEICSQQQQQQQQQGQLAESPSSRGTLKPAHGQQHASGAMVACAENQQQKVLQL
jgi:hypothetical protein